MYVELTFKLFENFSLYLNGLWPHRQKRTIAVFMYNLFETIEAYCCITSAYITCIFSLVCWIWSVA